MPPNNLFEKALAGEAPEAKEINEINEKEFLKSTRERNKKSLIKLKQEHLLPKERLK